MRISAISRTPAHPPPTNATINHQAETILAPVSHGLATAHVFFRALARSRTFLKKIRRMPDSFQLVL